MARHRNYKVEYQNRITKGLAAGKSRSAARGHVRAADLPKPKTGPIDRDAKLEKALARMKHGASQASAAKNEGVSVEKLRLYRLQNTASKRQGRSWVIFDTRPQGFLVATRGELTILTLPRDAGTEVSAYWKAVNEFLASNRIDHLEPFVGHGVRDVRDRFHPFETRPNVLRKLDSIGELDFLEIYADVAE